MFKNRWRIEWESLSLFDAAMVVQTCPRRLVCTAYGNTAAQRGRSVGDLVVGLSSAEAAGCEPPGSG